MIHHKIACDIVQPEYLPQAAWNPTTPLVSFWLMFKYFISTVHANIFVHTILQQQVEIEIC